MDSAYCTTNKHITKSAKTSHNKRNKQNNRTNINSPCTTNNKHKTTKNKTKLTLMAVSRLILPLCSRSSLSNAYTNRQTNTNKTKRGEQKQQNEQNKPKKRTHKRRPVAERSASANSADEQTAAVSTTKPNTKRTNSQMPNDQMQANADNEQEQTLVSALASDFASTACFSGVSLFSVWAYNHITTTKNEQQGARTRTRAKSHQRSEVFLLFVFRVVQHYTTQQVERRIRHRIKQNEQQLHWRTQEQEQ